MHPWGTSVHVRACVRVHVSQCVLTGEFACMSGCVVIMTKEVIVSEASIPRSVSWSSTVNLGRAALELVLTSMGPTISVTATLMLQGRAVTGNRHRTKRTSQAVSQ